MVRILPASIEPIDYTPPDTGLDPAPPEPPSVLEGLGAAFRTENPETVSIGRAMRRRGMIDDPDYRLTVEDLAGYEDQAHRFITSASSAETALIKREIDSYRKDKDTLDQFHWSGQFLMEGLAGVTTLSTLLPAGGIARTATGAVRLGRTAARVGALGGLSAAVDEALLYQQPGRTKEEALAGVAFGALFAGTIGGASGLFARKAFDRRMRMYAAADEGDEAVEKIVAEGMAQRPPSQAEETYFRDPEFDLRVDAVTARHIADELGVPIADVMPTTAARADDIVTPTRSSLHRALGVVYRAADDANVRLSAGDGAMQTAIRALRSFVQSDAVGRDIAQRAGVDEAAVRSFYEGAADPATAANIVQARREIVDDLVDRYKADPRNAPTEFRVAMDAADDAVAMAAARTDMIGMSGAKLAEAHDATSRMTERGNADTLNQAAREVTSELDKSAGAAVAPRLDPTGDALTPAGRRVMKVARLLRDPLAALQTSESPMVRSLVTRLAETTGIKTKYNAGHAEQLSVETKLRFWRGRSYLATANMTRLFLKHRGYDVARYDATIGAELVASQALDVAKQTPAGKLTFNEFKRRVYLAKMLGTQDEVAEVTQAAEFYEKTLYAPLRDAAIKQNLLPPHIAPEPGEFDRYMNRVYDHTVLSAQRGRFIKMAKAYMEQEQAKKAEMIPVLQEMYNTVLLGETEVRKAERRVDGIDKYLDRLKYTIAEAEFGFRRAETRSELADDRAIAVEADVEDATRRRDDIVEEIAAEVDEYEALASEGVALRKAGRAVRAEEMELRAQERQVLNEALAADGGALREVFNLLTSDRRRRVTDADIELAETFASAAEAAGLPLNSRRDFARFFDNLSIRPDAVLREIEIQLVDMANEVANRSADIADGGAVLANNIAALRESLRAVRAERTKLMANRRVTRAVQRETDVSLRQRDRRLARLYERRARAQYMRDELTRQMTARRQELEDGQDRLEDQFLQWEGHSSAEAKSAVKQRDKAAETAANPPIATKWEPDPNRPGAMNRVPDPDNQRAPREQGRWASVDRSVMKGVKSILDNQERWELTAAEIESRANELRNRILATPGNRLPYEADADSFDAATRMPVTPGARGALRSRLWNIPDDYRVTVDGDEIAFSDFLLTDMEVVSGMHVRTVAPDVVLSETFGAPRPGDKTWLAEQKAAINRDYDALMDRATTDNQRRSIDRRRDQDLKDIDLIVDRLRGSLALPIDPNGLRYRVQNALLNLNVIRLLGGMTISALPDVMHVVMYNGFSRAGLLPALRGLVDGEALAMSKQQLQAFSTAIDIMTNHRAAQLSDMVIDHHRLTRFERGLEAATANFGKFGAGMNYWNQAVKHIAGMTVMSRMIPAIEDLAAGRATQKDIGRLAYLGIGEYEAQVMAKQLARHKREHKGVHFPETHAWRGDDEVEDEIVQQMAQHLGGQIAAEVDRIIVTPGQEIPGFMGLPGVKLITQFRSFQVSAMQRIMAAGVQQHDAYALSGLMLMLAMGAMAYGAKQKLADREISDDPSVILREAIDRSGVTGWLFDVNNMLEKATRGSVGLSAVTGGPPMSRFASRSVVGALWGPSFGLGNDFVTTFGALTNPTEMTQGDTRAMFRMMPMQNVFWLRWAFNAMRQDVDEAFGIPERR